MKRIILSIIGALFMGALVTEFSTRLFPDNNFALFLLASLGAAATSLVVSSKYGAAGTSIQKKSNTIRPRPGSTTDSPGYQGDSVPDQIKRSQKTLNQVGGEREIGTVKWFNRNKGFGFIVRKNGEEIFVHYHSIRSSDSDKETRHSLRDGQTVAFRVVERSKGPQADDVSPVDDPRP